MNKIFGFLFGCLMGSIIGALIGCCVFMMYCMTMITIDIDFKPTEYLLAKMCTVCVIVGCAIGGLGGYRY